MFGPLGLPEILFILVIALLIFGPKRLPEIGRTVGKALSEFRRASEELKRTVNSEIAALDAETRKAAADVVPELAGKIPTQTMARGALTSTLGLDGLEAELREEIQSIPEAAGELVAETGLPVPGRVAALARRRSAHVDGLVPGLEQELEPSVVEEPKVEQPPLASSAAVTN